MTGPFVDNMGIDMLQGGGKLFLGSSGRYIGPGHFGLLDLGDGVQKFSCHYEADLDRGGISVLDIRPLLWRDGWPVAGDNFRGGHLPDRIGAHRHGARTGRAGRAGRRRARARRTRRGAGGGGAAGGGAAATAGAATRYQRRTPRRCRQLAGRPVDVRMSPYMVQAQQKWSVTPVANAGGYPGSPYFKITIAGTDRALAATADARARRRCRRSPARRSSCGASTSSPTARIA